MKVLIKIEMVFVFAAVVFVGGCLEAEETDVGRDRQQRMETQIEEIRQQEEKSKHIKLFTLTKALKKEDIKFTFYGKVVDFSGNPVSDVTVKAYMSYFKLTADLFSGTKKIEVKTDGNGLFSFTAKGKTLGFEGFEKTGYEYNSNWEHNKANRSFMFGKAYLGEDFEFKRNEPIVYTLRKRGKREWLYKGELRLGCKKDEARIREFRLLENWTDDYGLRHLVISKEKKALLSQRKRLLEYGTSKDKWPDEIKNVDPEYDIKLTCSMSPDGGNYEVTFDYIGKDGGIILSNELLYKAPEHGYDKQQIKLSGLAGKKNPHKKYKRRLSKEELYHIYVKRNGGASYSRLEVKIYSNSGSFRVTGYFYTNPAASRYLEYDYDIISAESKRRSVLSRRCRMIIREAWAKYYKDKRKKKDTPMLDEEAIKKAFKEMIRQERKAGNGNANN